MTIWAALVGATVVVVATAVGCWLETSAVGWLTNIGVLAVVMVVVIGYDWPGRHLVRAPFGWSLPLCGIAGAASVVRFDRLRWPHVTSIAMAGAVVTLVVLAFVVWGLREPGHATVEGRLSFPLPSGRWAVAAGGVSTLNHHLATEVEAGALDLVALRPDGARAAGVCPTVLADYEAYGREVVSPCSGLVIECVDDEPDQVPLSAGPCPGLGNHVRIDNGYEVIQLAHLRPGSVCVATGDRVMAGQRLGLVGNSGNSSEPHLHVHAERDGVGLRLRFNNVRAARLWPGATIAVH